MPNTLVPIPLARKHEQRSSANPVTIERLINMYAEVNPEGSPAPVTLYPTPGLALKDEAIGTGVIRGIHPLYVSGAWAWVIASGAELYHYDGTDLNPATLIGSIAAGSSVVKMAASNTQMLLSTGANTYYSNGATIAAVTGAPSNVSGVAHQDGYGILTEANTQKWWVTNLDDMSTVGGLAFTSADAIPGKVMGCASYNQEVWIFKDTGIEIYQNTGASPFPFQRVQVINGFGLLDHNTIAQADGRLFWIGGNRRPYTADGYTPRVLAGPTLSDAIFNASTDACFTHAFKGHTFYVVSGTTHTYVYDNTTDLWHRRASLISGDHDSPWRVRVGYDANSAVTGLTTLVGNRSVVGAIYGLLDPNTASGVGLLDSGGAIRREIIPPPITAGGDRRVVMSELHVVAEYGSDTQNGLLTDADILLSWSDDYGNTWVTDRSGSLGAEGSYNYRTKFTRLGSFRTRSLRIRVTDPVRLVLSGLFARMSVGD